MNPDFAPILAKISWEALGFWWCLFFFLTGFWLGWLMWKKSEKEAGIVEEEYRKVQSNFQKRSRIFAQNEEFIEALSDPTSPSGT
jgi:hypothetical protein